MTKNSLFFFFDLAVILFSSFFAETGFFFLRPCELPLCDPVAWPAFRPSVFFLLPQALFFFSFKNLVLFQATGLTKIVFAGCWRG